MTRFLLHTVGLIVALGLGASAVAETQVVGFEDLSLNAESFWNGPDQAGELIPGRYGLERVGRFVSDGTVFVNAYDTTNENTWRSFAYSNQTRDTEQGSGIGFLNQFVATPGSGHGPGADNYAIAFGHHDTQPSSDLRGSFDTNDPEHLNALPTFELPFGRSIHTLQITNSQYVTDSIGLGDQFAKKFGGLDGIDPDWFKVTAYGSDEVGQPLGVSVDFYLADFRFADSTDDYILRDWSAWDLSAMSSARRVHFNLSSSDNGQFGMNTPAYFAIDDVALDITVLPGDYNLDGRVDAADYTVWRDGLGTDLGLHGSGADGDLSGVVDQGDRIVWQEQYGRSLSTPTAVPEPSAASLTLLALLVFLGGQPPSQLPIHTFR